MPHFARPGEPPRGALLRIRPALVLADCDHPESCSEEFIGPAIMTGARVLLFRSRRTVRDMSDLAARVDVRVVDMPADHEALTSILRAMIPTDSSEGDSGSARPL